ncbi:MAG: tRNA uridine(34) 5-carboxymethylaminomethyl modification radical SAM/GNAT enzyme Elp3 [Candidatus Magasanikbacteria bacterium]|nr:tRNA uridine(34) 5-carboxymethylaminomethyl modification radical SAM/GNAT enzyme Elp3 [Candidatus Magasanikbacteria bacterium]
MTLTEKIILAAVKHLPKTEEQFNALKRAVVLRAKEPALPTKTNLLSAYHRLLAKKRIVRTPALEKLLTRRAVRSLSGVAIVTSLVKPYPCPGECVYCPLDERMPKSYLSEEPAAMRALTLKFDPYEQMARRIEALENNGHPTDKIEFILKGGTWNSYPLSYQYWFILKTFEACNTCDQKNPKLTKLTETSPLAELKKALAREQRKNETAKHRIIGLTLETRPDFINYHTIWQMREQGCTRLEVGVQHTDDKIMALTKRGHTIEQAREATELLRNYGFKVDFHLMPQLPGATPKEDLQMMESVFTDPGLKPDMIKIYPCSVVKDSELYDWFVAGKHQAYPTRNLIDIIKTFKTHIPRYARVSRLIRDIPGQYIENGNMVTNLRQVIEMEMKRDSLVCKCLRCREIGHVKTDDWTAKELKPVLFIDKYDTRGGTEYFLSYEDKLRRVVFAFCRLRLVDKPIIHPNKKLNSYSAYIRELHTYGQLVRIGKKHEASSQHKGLGKKLVALAEKITKKHGLKKLAVISGVGVRDYYRKWGYRLEKTYMVKNTQP